MAAIPFLVKPFLADPIRDTGNVAAPVALLGDRLKPLVVLDDRLNRVAVFPGNHYKLVVLVLKGAAHGFLIGDFG